MYNEKNKKNTSCVFLSFIYTNVTAVQRVFGHRCCSADSISHNRCPASRNYLPNSFIYKLIPIAEQLLKSFCREKCQCVIEPRKPLIANILSGDTSQKSTRKVSSSVTEVSPGVVRRLSGRDAPTS